MSKEQNQTPPNTKITPKPSISDENGEKQDTLFTPRFRSVAAMAGWDEEALLLATLVVEDTPDRESKHKKRINSHFKSPPTTGRRIKRVNRRSVIPTVVLDLDDEETIAKEETDKKNETNADSVITREDSVGNRVVSSRDGTNENVIGGQEEGNAKKVESTNENAVKEEVKEAPIAQTSTDSSSGSALPCMNKLREELSCAICLDICFEPSTTSCGHSFCKKCLRSAADKCGKKCPKCRQLISNGRSCTVNTVLWNTIQLLFPQEVESRKATEATKTTELACRAPEKDVIEIRRGSSRASLVPSREVISGRRRRGVPSQAEDAALALRLQREEFMRGNREQEGASFTTARELLGGGASFSSARENLRAMASRAVNLRVRRP